MDRIARVDNRFDGNGNPNISTSTPYTNQTYLNAVWSPTLSQEFSLFIPVLYNLGDFNIQKPTTLGGAFKNPELPSVTFLYQLGLTEETFSPTVQASYEYHRLNELHTLAVGYSHALDIFDWQFSASLNVHGVWNTQTEDFSSYMAPLLETYKPISDSFKLYLATNGAYSSDWNFWRTTAGFEYLVNDNVKLGTNLGRTWTGKWVYRDTALELFAEWLFEY